MCSLRLELATGAGFGGLPHDKLSLLLFPWCVWCGGLVEIEEENDRPLSVIPYRISSVRWAGLLWPTPPASRPSDAQAILVVVGAPVRLSSGGDGLEAEPGQRLQLSSWFCPIWGDREGAGQEVWLG